MALGIVTMCVSQLPVAGVTVTGAAACVCGLVALAIRSLRRAGQRIDAILTEELERPADPGVH